MLSYYRSDVWVTPSDWTAWNLLSIDSRSIMASLYAYSSFGYNVILHDRFHEWIQPSSSSEHKVMSRKINTFRKTTLWKKEMLFVWLTRVKIFLRLTASILTSPKSMRRKISMTNTFIYINTNCDIK